ncbi:MAG TPA: MFS transporter [Clostridiales bacterium]|nr:MFS transporter [Clostridiales bacterium]
MRDTQKLFHKDFSLVVIGQIISLFGNAILRFALPLFVLRESGSAALFGLVSASAFIPMVIMSPIGGIVADRVNKQRIMVVLDAITTAIIAVFMLLMGTAPMIPLVVVILMLLYGIQGAYAPAVQASVPLLAEGDLLVPANAVVNLVQSLAGLLGPVAGGILFGRFGLWPILAVSCGCFAFSAFIELFIKIPFKKRPRSKSVWALVKGDLKESAGFITKEYPIMSRVIVITFCLNLCISTMLLVGMPVIITEYLGISSELYGISQGILAGGGLLGGILAGVLGKKLRLQRAYLLLLLGAAAILPMGIALLMGAPPFAGYIVITAMAAFIMACGTMVNIQMLAFVQAVTPGDLVGKVIALVMTVNLCAQPVGQALYGFLFEYLAGAPWVIVLGSALASFGIAAYSRIVFSKLPGTAVKAEGDAVPN